MIIRRTRTIGRRLRAGRKRLQVRILEVATGSGMGRMGRRVAGTLAGELEENRVVRIGMTQETQANTSIPLVRGMRCEVEQLGEGWYQVYLRFRPADVANLVAALQRLDENEHFHLANDHKEHSGVADIEVSIQGDDETDNMSLLL